MEEESETKMCSNCKRDIPVVNYIVHTVHCARNIKVCPVCKEPVPVAELEEHHERLHKMSPCKLCGEAVCGTDMEDHIRDSCGHTVKPCRYCELEVPRRELPAHEGYCGARTERCHCGEYVMIKYRQLHLDSNHGFIKLDDEPDPPNGLVLPPSFSRSPRLTTHEPTSNPIPNTNKTTTQINRNVLRDLPIASASQSGSKSDLSWEKVDRNGSTVNHSPIVNRTGTGNQGPSGYQGASGNQGAPGNQRASGNQGAPENQGAPGNQGALHNGPSTSNYNPVRDDRVKKRQNCQPQVNISAASPKNKASSGGAVKKRPAPAPPRADPRRDAAYNSAVTRQNAEERQRQQLNAYNAARGLPPVLNPAQKLEKLRKMDALQNPERQDDDSYKNTLQGRVWRTPDVTIGNVLGSETARSSTYAHLSHSHDNKRVKFNNNGEKNKLCVSRNKNKVAMAAEQRNTKEARERDQINAYNLAHGLPPVLTPAQKLEKLRKMDALQNPERQDDDSYKNILQGRVWRTPDVPVGNVLGSDVQSVAGSNVFRQNERNRSVDPRELYKDLQPMSEDEFLRRFEQIRMEDGVQPPWRQEGKRDSKDRFSQIKISLSELRRGLNEVTAPFNNTANSSSDQRNRSPEFLFHSQESDRDSSASSRSPSPNYRNLSPSHRNRSPSRRNRSPSHRNRSPSHRNRSPSHQNRLSPNYFNQNEAENMIGNENNNIFEDAENNEIMLPCEFCGMQVAADDLVQHQTGCRPDLVQCRRSASPLDPHVPAAPAIPCEFCGVAQPVYLLEQHQESCGGLPRAASPPPARRVSPPSSPDVIPCEFCTESLPVHLFYEHQPTTRKRSTSAVCDNTKRMQWNLLKCAKVFLDVYRYTIRIKQAVNS